MKDTSGMINVSAAGAFYLGFELAAGYAGLTNDGLQRADPDLCVIRNRDRYGCVREFFLHDDMAPALTDLSESMPREDSADVLPGKDAQLTQQRPPGALRKSHRGSAA